MVGAGLSVGLAVDPFPREFGANVEVGVGLSEGLTAETFLSLYSEAGAEYEASPVPLVPATYSSIQKSRT